MIQCQTCQPNSLTSRLKQDKTYAIFVDSFLFPFWIILVEIKSCLLKNDRNRAMTPSYAAVTANYPQICSPEHLRQLGKARPTYNYIATQQLHLHECRDIRKPFSSPQNPQRNCNCIFVGRLDDKTVHN